LAGLPPQAAINKTTTNLTTLIAASFSLTYLEANVDAALIGARP
jgi:hypothetical protein